MVIEIIDKKVLDALLAELAALTAKVELLRRHCEDKGLKNWLDNEDVCQILRISPRTLQILRNQRRIGCVQIKHKFFYKPEDVKQLMTSIHLYRKPWDNNTNNK